MEDTIVVSADEERELLRAVLQAHGFARAGVELQAEQFLEGDLRGHPSHGMQRIFRIIERLDAGLIDPDPRISTTWRTPSFAHLDAGCALGAVAGWRAVDEARRAAATVGAVFVAVANASHLGMLAPYVEALARDGLIAIALTTSEALVHPLGGRTAMVGTNPLAIAVPADPDPFVLDMATGLISMGKVLAYENRGMRLEPGWALDAAGEPTTDPALAKGGSIAPFGGAKGYGLGVAIELLVASLSSTALGTDVLGTLDAQHPVTKGDLFIVLDTGPLALAGFADTSRYLDALRACPPSDPAAPVSVPGDGARARRAERLRDGIPHPRALWKNVQRLATTKPAAR
ncbi:MAG: Ldh family oxidoreductase [Microbacteriaceae bacterium]